MCVVLNAAVVRLPAPSETIVFSTVGAVRTGFDTFTATPAEVAVLALMSRATAVSVCDPFAIGSVFQVTW